MNKYQINTKLLGVLAFAAGYHVGRRYELTLIVKKGGK